MADNAVRPTGRVEVIIGPMFAGKTTLMISKVERAAIAELDCLIIKHTADSRYTDEAEIHAHSGRTVSESNSISTVKANCLEDVSEQVKRVQVVGIDEGQFYPDLIACCEKWANAGKRVIVAALDGTYAREPFAQVCDLVCKSGGSHQAPGGVYGL